MQGIADGGERDRWQWRAGSDVLSDLAGNRHESPKAVFLMEKGAADVDADHLRTWQVVRFSESVEAAQPAARLTAAALNVSLAGLAWRRAVR